MDDKIASLQSSYQTRLAGLLREIQRNKQDLEDVQREKEKTLEVILLASHLFYVSQINRSVLKKLNLLNKKTKWPNRSY